MDVNSNIAAEGCPLLKKSFIAAGKHIMATTSEDIEVPDALTTDVVLITIESNDTTAAYTNATGAISAKGVVTLTVNAAGTGDGVLSFMVIRPQ